MHEPTMKLWRGICASALKCCAWLILPAVSEAQGTLQRTITFDGPPPIASSSEISINYYYEQALEFRPIGNAQFGRSGGGAAAGFPRNGTAYLFGAFGDSLAATWLGGQRFGL